MVQNGELVARWREEVGKLKTSLEGWQSGRMKLLQNDVDVTAEHVEQLKRVIVNVEEAIQALER